MLATQPTPTPPKKPTPVETLWRAIFAAIRPADVMVISEWAEKNRVLASESAFQTGRFRCFPYQREPMDSPTDKDVIETVLWWAAQLGKTEVVISIAGFFMDADPAPQLLVQPTIDLAKAFSEERLAPEIRDNKALRKIVRDPRSRDSGNKLLSKRYPGGNVALVGANAPSGLAGRPRRVIQLDEVDRFPLSAGTEGDPCALADKRAESFPNAVKVKTSTATIRGLSKIEALYEASDKRKWHLKCRKCSGEFVVVWKDVKWPDKKPEEAFIQCPCCAATIDDEERRQMVRKGQWKATAPFTGRRGYWLNGLNTLFPAHKGYRNRLHQFVAEFLKAKDGGAETMRVWTNTFLAETYEEDAEALDAGELSKRGEAYSGEEMPVGVLILTAAADVHRMRIEVEVKGWGIDEECWGISKRVLDGDTERDEVWAQLDELLLGEFTREDGVKIGIERTFIDMGYRSKQVLKFCAPRIGRGVYPCRGINRVGTNVPPLLPAKPNRNNKARIPHWNVGVSVAKTTVFDRLKLESPGPRTMHFPEGEGYDEEYFKQFSAEKRKIKYSSGVAYFIFEKLNNAIRNEALDLGVYNLAALNSLMPIFWRKVAAVRKKEAEDENKKAEKAAQRGEADKGGVPETVGEESGRKNHRRSEEGGDSAAHLRSKQPAAPTPLNYTEQKVQEAMRRMRKGKRRGFVGGWK